MIKPAPILLILAFLVLTCPLSGQNKTAASLLSTAIYEEEVSGNLNKAIELYLDILKKYPDERPEAAKALYHLGIATEKLGSEKAIEYYNRLINNYPEQKELVGLAKAKVAQLNRSASDFNVQAEQSFGKGSDLFKNSRFESAVAEFEKVILLAPKSRLAEESHLWIGHCYFKLRDYNQALTAFQSIRIGFPDSPFIPVADLMISQVQQILTKEPENRPFLFPDEKTILDPNTQIRYTVVNSLAGENDEITHALLVSDISPNRKYFVAQNKIYFFDHSTPIVLFEDSTSFRPECRLSPDASWIVCLSEKKILVIPISSETGHPSGAAREFPNSLDQSWRDLNWSPDSKKLLYSVFERNSLSSLWTLSIEDGSMEQVTNSYFNGFLSKPVFAANGSNVLFYHRGNKATYSLKMASTLKRKSVTLIDTSRYFSRFELSPDNNWILYEKPSRDKYLFRLADGEEQKLVTPDGVGDFVSWADEGHKLYFYRPSSDAKNSFKVVSAFGGPAYELGNESGQFLRGWTPDSRALIATAKGLNPLSKIGFISLIRQDFREISGLAANSFFTFSPDFSKIIVAKNPGRLPTDLLVVPFSANDLEISGDPEVIFKDYNGWSWGYSWSPESDKIALCSDGEVWICNTDEGNSVILSHTPEKESQALWSPDGKYIATRTGLQFKLIRYSDREVLLTQDSVDSWSWSPDGKEIALACYNYQLISLSVPDGNSRVIANWKKLCNSTYLDGIYWSPDGRWIAVNGPADEVDLISKIYLVNPIDGKVTELAADDPASKVSMYWSPDSKWIAYSTLGQNKARLESTFWEADLTEFMNNMPPGKETSWTTDFDFEIPAIPPGGKEQDGVFTDPRDGNPYPYKQFGEQTWMTKNLAFLPAVHQASDSSALEPRFYVHGYDSTDLLKAKRTDTYQKYGVLYNYPAAKKSACPAGWHLPDDSEWMGLEKSLGMDTANLRKTFYRTSGGVGHIMKSIKAWEDDDLFLGFSGFNALPGGYRRSSPEHFRAETSMATFWTFSSENDLIAGGRFLNTSQSGVTLSFTVGQTAGFSVRCVRDD